MQEKLKGIKQRVYLQIDGKQIPRARWVMSQHLGRVLLPSEIVHHINEDKMDDSIENLQLMSAAEHTRVHQLGKKASKETRAKMSSAAKGKIVTEITRKKLSISSKRWSNSPEAKQQMSKLHKGKIISLETREKMRQARLGKTRSEEEKRKTSESLKIAWARRLEVWRQDPNRGARP